MKTITFFLLILFVLECTGQNNAFDYFGIHSPGDKIELFAPNIVSLKDSKDYSLAVSPLGDEVFFATGTWPESKLMHVKKEGNVWTKPEIAAFASGYFAVEPAFSPDGKYLFFSSSKGMEDINQYSIWRVEKVGKNWENATKVIDIAEPEIWEFHPGITNDGTVYFCYWDSKTNKGSIYKSEYSKGNYSEPVKVDLPLTGDCSVTNPFVDRGERFIIISAETENSTSKYDTFISYRKNTGWSEPVNFGDRFNTPEVDESFDISPDGKFLFIYKQDDIYWTETKGVIQ